MKRLLWLVMLLLMATSASAQNTLSTTACPGSGCMPILLSQETGTVGIQITGTFVGTLEFEKTIDGATWVQWWVNPNGATTPVVNTTAAGFFSGPAADAKSVRVRFSAYTSGSAIVTADLSAVASILPLGPLAAGSALVPDSRATLTTSVNIKATAGNVYGVFALNGAATTCWVQFINSAGAGALGTGVIFSVPLPASTTTPVYIAPTPFPLAQFTTGIAVGISTTATGATACGTAGSVVTFYK